MIKQLKRSLAISLLGLAVLPAGSAFAQSDQWNSLYDRIIRLEAEVRGGGRAGAGGGGNVQMQAQLQQLSAQMNAMAQQIYDMQRELNRLRELERQGLLFKNKRRVATAIAPQQQSGQWDQGQVAPAPDYGRLQQSVEIERAPSAGAEPRRQSKSACSARTTDLRATGAAITAPGPAAATTGTTVAAAGAATMAAEQRTAAPGPGRAVTGAAADRWWPVCRSTTATTSGSAALPASAGHASLSAGTGTGTGLRCSGPSLAGTGESGNREA
jgi:TolA-binding protein